jgi:hypothetical protein
VDIFNPGRVYTPDPEDARFRVSFLREAEEAALEPVHDSRYWWANGIWVDQGSTGTCVGHGVTHYAEDGPVTQPGSLDPMAVYDRATEIDEWPQNDHDRSFGTSVRAGIEVLREKRMITTYHWAMNWPEFEFTILDIGPLVLGVDWFEDMFFPVDGLIRPTGALAGGHCIVADGYNSKTKVARLKNSWGRGWGKNGFCYIRREDLEYLLFGANGEACISNEIRYKEEVVTNA